MQILPYHFSNNCKCTDYTEFLYHLYTSTAFWGLLNPVFCNTRSSLANCLHFCNNCKCIQSIRLTSTAFWGFSDPLFCKTSSTHLTRQLQTCRCTKYTRSAHSSGRASLHLLWSVGKVTRVPWKAIEVENPKGVKMRKGIF